MKGIILSSAMAFAFALALLAGPAMAYDKDRNRCFSEPGCTGPSEGNILSLDECKAMVKADTDLQSGSYLDNEKRCINLDKDGNVVK